MKNAIHTGSMFHPLSQNTYMLSGFLYIETIAGPHFQERIGTHSLNIFHSLLAFHHTAMIIIIINKFVVITEIIKQVISNKTVQAVFAMSEIVGINGIFGKNLVVDSGCISFQIIQTENAILSINGIGLH